VRIQILPEAREDLIAGYQFYESRAAGLGSYFRDSLLEDVDALATNAGIHAKVLGYHRSLGKRFHSQFIIAWKLMWFGFARSPIAAEIPRGFGAESAIARCR
jgi:hypothetical protein